MYLVQSILSFICGGFDGDALLIPNHDLHTLIGNILGDLANKQFSLLTLKYLHWFWYLSLAKGGLKDRVWTSLARVGHFDIILNLLKYWGSGGTSDRSYETMKIY